MCREKKNKKSRVVPPLENLPIEPLSEEIDLLPEFISYRDQGCHVYIACLSCPLSRCVFEHSNDRSPRKNKRRNHEIVRLFTPRENNVKELALRFGLSPRTVQRVVAAARKKSRILNPES